MEIPDNKTVPFDHLAEFDYLESGESLIDKITQIDVYVTDSVCVNYECTLPTASVLSLRVTYALLNCTTQSRTQGGYYTDGNRSRVQSMTFPPGVFLTAIEFNFDYVAICDSHGFCIAVGPYNGTEPSTVFVQSNFVIKAFFGSSGSWLDKVGVTIEPFGQSTSTCGF